MVTDLWFAENDLREGYIQVVDMQGCSLMHLPRLNPIVMKKFMFYIQARTPIHNTIKLN